MRSTAGEIANALAWAVLLVLVGVAILIADWLGFAGLFILGMLTWVICVQVELGDDTPTASIAVFRARMARERSPERRAAARAERQVRLSPLPFYRWCGIGLTVVGAAGFVWQRFAAGS
jgi:hypothetical protein